MSRVQSFKSVRLALSAFALASCGPSDGGFELTPPRERSSPYAEDGARCQDRYAFGELMEREDAADPAALRCLLSIRDREPDSFDLRYRLYRLYRIEGVEPEGLDALVRDRTRESLSLKLATVHTLYPALETVEFARGSACRVTCFPFSRPRKSGKFSFSGLGCWYEEKADETVKIH
ncbi:hypothetical protein ACWCOP_14180 [Maricaulaceae bacterium MS644]